MADEGSGQKLLIGLLVGFGLGVAAALLLAPGGGARRRAALANAAREVADRMTYVGRPDALVEKRTSRAGRALIDRLDRARSAGL
ncbi:MAG TPA: hypothetical protein VD788_15215 [Candidatus Polarisedimenticolaceae bacterium]|nr:hypothetical protein [Candidatus Polarisedimenticolaceae bacterium]